MQHISKYNSISTTFYIKFPHYILSDQKGPLTQGVLSYLVLYFAFTTFRMYATLWSSAPYLKTS